MDKLTSNHFLTQLLIREDIATWRHDLVLQVFVHGLQHLIITFMLISLVTWLVPVHQAPSTVPPSSSSRSSRPDIVLISDDHIILLELSVVTNCKEHYATASSRK